MVSSPICSMFIRKGPSRMPQRTERMGKLLALIVKAGVAYAVTVFAIGFLLGTARVLLLAPYVGSTIAVSVEAPIIPTTSGNASIVAGAVSKSRPPWFETMTPDTPDLTARSPSSGFNAPLSSNGTLANDRRHSTSFRVAAGLASALYMLRSAGRRSLSEKVTPDVSSLRKFACPQVVISGALFFVAQSTSACALVVNAPAIANALELRDACRAYQQLARPSPLRTQNRLVAARLPTPVI